MDDLMPKASVDFLIENTHDSVFPDVLCTWATSFHEEAAERCSVFDE